MRMCTKLDRLPRGLFCLREDGHDSPCSAEPAKDDAKSAAEDIAATLARLSARIRSSSQDDPMVSIWASQAKTLAEAFAALNGGVDER